MDRRRMHASRRGGGGDDDDGGGRKYLLLCIGRDRPVCLIDARFLISPPDRVWLIYTCAFSIYIAF